MAKATIPPFRCFIPPPLLLEEEDTVKATKTKRKAEMNRYVSPDIIEEILSYLPCKSLLRFKVVCKQWESLLYDSRFIDKHRSRNMNHPLHLLVFDDSSDSTKMTLHMYEIGMDGYSHVKTVKTAISKLYDVLAMASYGLVCLYSYHNRKLVVFNPYTEQIRILQDYPEPFDDPETYFNNLGFGFDVKSKKYKAVQLVTNSKTHRISKCHVLTLERFESCWREINDASLDLKAEDISEDLSYPVCVDGVIYWETEWAARTQTVHDKRIRILTFDLRCEKINMILAPKECEDIMCDLCGGHLVELQGNLCFVGVTCTIDDLKHMDIWKLNYSNDGHVVWAPMYKLDLGSWFTGPCIFPMCIIGRRIILRGDGVIMYCYDVEEKCLKMYKGIGEDLVPDVYLLDAETIVSLDGPLLF